MSDKIKQDWWEYHRSNTHVYDMFEKFTLDVINAGHANFSAKAIFERMRWETAIETNDPDFKLQNNFTAYYSRYFMNQHPEFDGFFRTRNI